MGAELQEEFMAVIISAFAFVLVFGVLYIGWHFAKFPLWQRTRFAGRGRWPLSFLASFLLFALSLGLMGVHSVLLLYIFLGYLAADLLRCILRFSPKVPKLPWNRAVFLFAAVFTIYGYWNASHVVLQEYEMSVTAPAASGEFLRVALVSDIHLGTAVSLQGLLEMKELAEAQEPDLFCLVGDIFDESTTEEEIAAAVELFGEMASNQPVYYTFGNHESYMERSGDISRREIRERLEAVGVTVLEDEVVQAEGYVIAGRKDASQAVREPTAELLAGVDSSYPVILLDHQPRAVDIALASETAADLQLSGHTHAGQIVPGRLLSYIATGKPVEYGYRTEGELQVITTAGLGTWGIPVRTEAHAEIVMVKIEVK